MRNPFRRRAVADGTEQRALTGDSVSWLAPNLAEPVAPSVDGALRLAPVFAATRILASQVSSLPPQAYRRNGDQRERISAPSLFGSPSATGTTRDWLFRAMTSLVLRGNAVGLITDRDAMERPLKLEWLNPADVFVEDAMMFGPGSFTDPKWFWLGQHIPTEDIVHIPWFTLPGKVWGLSPIGAYAVTVSTGLAAQRYSDDWFKAGGVPPGTFKNAEKTVDQKQANIIKARMLAAIRTHEPIVYGNDWEYTPITISPQDAQFVETMKLTANQIAAIYGIPPSKLGGETGDSMTYSNVESEGIHFLQYTLLPWLTQLEDVFSGLLSRRHYVKFNVDSLTRSDAQTRYSNYERARMIGLMNIDEIRALEDLPPLPNGAGQDYTPLPLIAGKPVSLPQMRGHLRVVEGDG
ncbi:MAG: phage portal protein [Streptosporangiales bacterium]